MPIFSSKLLVYQRVNLGKRFKMARIEWLLHHQATAPEIFEVLATSGDVHMEKQETQWI